MDSTRRQICCFSLAQKKKKDRRKSRSTGASGSSIEDGGWKKNDEILSDMSTFSVKEQEERLKKAMKEEERVNKEAERVVQWVKQESARMDVSAIQSLLSDDYKLSKS